MIDIVFGQAEKDAKRIVEIGEAINKASSDLATANNTISASWKSDQGTRYLNKSNKLKEDVSKRGKNLKTLGDGYLNYVNTLKSIEEGAKSIVGTIGSLF